MAFFFTDNPIALFLALVVMVAVVKILLGKHKWFKGDKAPYISLVLIILVIILLAYRPLLSMVSYGLPFFILVVLFLFSAAAVLFSFGMKESIIWPAMKERGPLKMAIQIFIVCIIALAVSQVYGEKLLEEPSVSFADAMTPEQETVEIDFAPMFTKQALGMIMLVVIMAFAFVFVNTAQ